LQAQRQSDYVTPHAGVWIETISFGQMIMEQ